MLIVFMACAFFSSKYWAWLYAEEEKLEITKGAHQLWLKSGLAGTARSDVGLRLLMLTNG
jgi:hypothetical protein